MSERVPRRTQAERRAATRDKLLQTARTLFTARGYAQVSADELVQAAGLTRGALYHHFPRGKEELLAALYDQIQGELSRRLDEVACGYPDRWEGFRASFHAYLQACLEDEVRQITLLDAHAYLSTEVFCAADEKYGVGSIRDDLAALAAVGIIPQHRVDVLAHMLVGAVNEAALWIARADDPQAALHDARLWMDVLFDGLEALRSR